MNRTNTDFLNYMHENIFNFKLIIYKSYGMELEFNSGVCL